MIKVLSFIFLLFLLGCQQGRDTWVVLKDGSRLVLKHDETLSTAIPSEPPSIDWLKSSDTSSSWIEEHLMNGLVRFDLTKPGLVLAPALAHTWQSSKKGLVWTFQLREGVKWTDGVPFTAQHVLDSFERILKPETGAIAVDNVFPILNAKEFNKGVLSDFSQVGVKKLGDFAVEFTLKEPMSFFPMLLTHHTTFPIRKDLIKKHKELWTEPEHLVTLGPYKMIHWHHDSRLILQRNENYWGDKPKIKNIVFYMVGKQSTQLRMFERGRIDFMKDIPSSEIPRLKKRPEFHTMPGLRLYYLGFKVNKKPFDNKLLRQAISQAINREEVVQVIGGGQLPLYNWIPHGMFGHDDKVGLRFNPAEAKRKLKRAGFNHPKDVPTIIYGFNTDEKHKRVAENIQAQLKKNLGLQVELKNEEWKTFLNGLRSASVYSIFRLGWVADYGDPHNFMPLLASYSENNRTGWKNQEFDELIAKGVAEQDPQKRLEIYHKAQKIAIEDHVPAIPIFTDVNQVLVAKRVKNYHDNVLDLYHFYTMELQK